MLFAKGSGLIVGVVEQPSTFTVNTNAAGHGTLLVSIRSPTPADQLQLTMLNWMKELSFRIFQESLASKNSIFALGKEPYCGGRWFLLFHWFLRNRKGPTKLLGCLDQIAN